jgi:membrane-associated phospholipid phosphatase
VAWLGVVPPHPAIATIAPTRAASGRIPHPEGLISPTLPAPPPLQSRAVSPTAEDRAVLIVLRTHGHAPSVERAVEAYSRLGEHGAGWLALGLAGALTTRDRDRRRHWLRGVRVVAGGYVLNQTLKLAVRRRRPQLPGLPPVIKTQSQLSFPSAHATTSFAGARAFAGLLPAVALYSVATTLALSRPYLGVHYPSDVLAGAALGTALAQIWPRPSDDPCR